MWGAIGNITTCNIQGFLIQFGFVGSMLYNASLSIYYVSVIKFGMSEEDIKKKIEPFLHFMANIYPLVTSIYLLQGQYYNSDDHLCWVATVPKECADDPDIECVRGDKNVYSLRLICFGYVVYTVVSIIVVNMTLIVYKVIAQKRRNNRWRFGNGRKKKSKRASASRLSARNLLGTCNSAPIQHLKPDSSGHDSSGHKSCTSKVPQTNGDIEDPHPFDLKAMRASVKNNMVEKRCNDIAEGASGRLRSSLKNENDYQDPLPFDLKAMRASIKLNQEKSNNSISSVPEGKMRSSLVSFDLEKGNCEDPHPFDLKGMRAKAKSEASLLDKKEALPDPTLATRGSFFRLSSSSLVQKPIDKDTEIPLRSSDVEKQTTWEKVESEEESKKKRPFSGSHRSDSSSRNSNTFSTRRGSVLSRRLSSAAADDEMKVMVQALLYISAFFSSVFFSGTVRILESKGIQAPFVIYELSRIFSPLQGLFNILIYTRPHVRSVRNQDSNMSWLRAFWMTIKTGGDNNRAGQGRRSDHRASHRVRERIERNHLLRMEQIRADAEKRRKADKEQSNLRVSKVERLSTIGRRLSLNHTKKLQISYHEEDVSNLHQNQEDDNVNDMVEKKMDGHDQSEQSDLKETMLLGMEGKDQSEQSDLKETILLGQE